MSENKHEATISAGTNEYISRTYRPGKEGNHTDFLLSHWHCILPVIGIIVAVIFLSDKPKEREKESDHRTTRIPNSGSQNLK